MRNIRELLTLSKSMEKKRIVVAAAHDEAVIVAVNSVMDLDICTATLIGDQEKILKILIEKGYQKENYTIIDSKEDIECAKLAVKLIREEQGDILMKGLIDTKVLLREVVDRETGIRGENLLSHVTLVSHPHLNRVIFATDCAMTLYPTVEQKIEIVKNAVELLHILGYENPKVGLISAVEKVNPKLISSFEAVEVKDYFLKNNHNCIVDGPFAVDNVLSHVAADHKGIKSPVAGRADILIFPNLDSGNVFYKTAVFLANAEAAGIIIGAKVPIVLTSRADLAITKIYSIALAGVYQHGKITRY